MNSSQKIVRHTIIYINFSPYTNAGYILDYLRDSYKIVICFTFRFHYLGNNQEKPSVTIFENGVKILQYPLLQLHVPPSLVFLLLPIRSVLFLIQIFYYLLLLQHSYGPYKVYFTVNAFTAWIGNILKRLHIVEKTLYWVWDYYPLHHENKTIALMRRIYWLFDHNAVKNASKVVFLSRKIAKIHSDRDNKTLHSFPVTEIGTKKKYIPIKHISNSINLVFFGVIKKSEGLEIIINTLKNESFNPLDITLHVIGGGPDVEYFKKISSNVPHKILFHGYVPSYESVDNILSTCHIGVATYLPTKENVTMYTDPSKLKYYLSCGIPVITTNVTALATIIHKSHAGRIVEINTRDVKNAIMNIHKKYNFYCSGAKKLAEHYEYARLYKQLLTIH